MRIPESQRLDRSEAYDRLKASSEEFRESLPPEDEINILVDREPLDAVDEYLNEIADILARCNNAIIEDAAADTITSNVPGLTKTPIRAAISLKVDERSREIPIEALENEA